MKHSVLRAALGLLAPAPWVRGEAPHKQAAGVFGRGQQD